MTFNQKYINILSRNEAANFAAISFGFSADIITVDGGCLQIYIVFGRIVEIYKVFMITVDGLRSGRLNASC